DLTARPRPRRVRNAPCAGATKDHAEAMAKTCLVLRHLAFEDLGILTPVIETAGYEIATHDLGVGAFPGRGTNSSDLLIVLGGPIGVYEAETYPFIVDEIEAIRARLGASRPT